MTKRELQTCFFLNLIVALILINIFLLTPVAATSSPELVSAAEYNFTPLLDSNPHGKVNLIVPIQKLLYDGVSNYDWYFYEVRIQMVPGKVAYGSSWRNGHSWAKHEVWSPGTYRWLVDYDPTTTIGETTVTVTVSAEAGPQGPSGGFSRSWSYTVRDVEVYDNSDFSQHRAYWEHDIDQSKSVGSHTYLSKPGFVVKTRQDHWSFIDAWYKVHFDRRTGFWWEYVSFESPTLYLDAYKYGDSIPPETPSTPSGSTSGYTYTTYDYSTSTVDFDDDYLRYEFGWDDGSTTTTGWYFSGANATASHSWSSPGTYYVKVRAQDETYTWSGWSAYLTVNIRNPYLTVLAEDQYGNPLTTGDVYIDGELVGYTGSTFTVAAGAHTVFVNDFWEAGTTGYRYGFQHWENGSTDNPRTITVEDTITAYFNKKWCPGDVNGDGRVDITDISIVSYDIGATRDLGDPWPPNGDRWDSRADVTRDNLIDGNDLTIVAYNYGHIYE